MTEIFEPDFLVRVEDSITIDIWIAGSQIELERAAGEIVDEVGLCVTFTKTWFRYTDGGEFGLRIGLRNYPRFPTTLPALRAVAQRIGLACAIAADQGSFMVEEVGSQTYWYSRRVSDNDITSGNVVGRTK